MKSKTFQSYHSKSRNISEKYQKTKILHNETLEQKPLPVEKWLTSFSLTPFFVVKMQTMPISVSRINLNRKKKKSNILKPNIVLEIFQLSFHLQLRSNAEKQVSEL